MAAYRMTPARRAALRKAQLESARKRRRGRRNTLLAGGATIATAVGVGAYLGSRQKKRVGPGRQVSKELVHVPGLGQSFTITDIDAFKRQRAREKRAARRARRKTQGHKVWKVTPSGEVIRTRYNADNSKARQRHNYERRREYWAGKPVANVGYSVSTKGSRKRGQKRRRRGKKK